MRMDSNVFGENWKSLHSGVAGPLAVCRP